MFELADERGHYARLVSGDAFFVRLIPLLFGLCVFVATHSTMTTSSVAAIWPANGILLAGLILAQDRSTRIKTLLACLVANILAGSATGQPLPVTVGFSIINLTEGSLAYLLLHRLGVHDLRLKNTAALLRFVAACAVPPLASAVIGASIVSAWFGADYTEAMVTWYMADALGLLVITPAFALAFQRNSNRDRQLPTYKIAGFAAALVAVCAVVFSQTLPLLFLVTPVCVAVAFHVGTRYAAFATLFLVSVSIYATCNGYGPAALISAEHEASRLLIIQIFCMVNHFSTFFVAASITERDNMRKRVEQLSATEHESRRHLDAALNAMNQGLCLFDHTSRITARNARFLEIYGLDPNRVPCGLAFDDLMTYCTQVGTGATSSAVRLPLSVNGDIDQRLADGRMIRISQRRLSSGGVICTYTDITEERRAQDALRHASLHDSLTGLPNRRNFANALAYLCEDGPTHEPFSVMFVDVDHFKAINDTHGHAAGDYLLQTVSKRLNACVRDSDIVARLGGDEFAVILSQTDDARTVRRVAERMLSICRQPIAIDGALQGAVGTVTLSIGIAHHAPGMEANDVMKLADTALYRVKDVGRNNFVILDGLPPEIPAHPPPDHTAARTLTDRAA